MNQSVGGFADAGLYGSERLSRHSYGAALYRLACATNASCAWVRI